MRYLKIETDNVLNGTGLRVVLWLSGCNHKCKNCQNPETWDDNNGSLYTEDTEEYILEQLSKGYIQGITFSGGDPLYENNLLHLYSLISKIRIYFPSKSIWLYTGYTIEQIVNPEYSTVDEMEDSYLRQQIISNCDVVVDGRYVDELRDITLKWRGSSNQRVIDIKKSMVQEKIVLYCD